MKTLNKLITQNFYINQHNGYGTLKRKWASLVAAKAELSVEYHLLYSILRGKDFSKAFPNSLSAALKKTHKALNNPKIVESLLGPKVIPPFEHFMGIVDLEGIKLALSTVTSELEYHDQVEAVVKVSQLSSTNLPC
jgi:hypothetical protein